MKKLFFTVSILFVLNGVYAQVVGDWSAPLAFTDTLSFNTHQNLLSGTTMLFFEKRADTISPATIYMKDVGSTQGEIPVFSNDTTEYRNPQPLDMGYFSNHIYYLLFESNENGNFDLFAMPFFNDYTFGTPYPILVSPDDETDLSLNTDAMQYGNRATWLSNDIIYTASIVLINDSLQFANIEMIDSGNCFHPVCTYNQVFWQKNVANEAQIYQSVSEDGIWSAPDVLYAFGNNNNLSISRSLFQAGWVNYLCWDNAGKILCYYNESNYQGLDTLDSGNFNSVIQPSSFYYDVLLDGIQPALSFTAGEMGSEEIYFKDMDWTGMMDMVNISNNNVSDSYSILFQGPAGSYSWDLYCIWQSHINGHEVLYGSKAVVLYGEVNENSTNRVVQIFPNPVRDEMQIRLATGVAEQELIAIEIFNNLGKKVDEIKPFEYLSNQNKISWNRGNLPNGVYYLKIKTIKGIWSAKFIAH